MMANPAGWELVELDKISAAARRPGHRAIERLEEVAYLPMNLVPAGPLWADHYATRTGRECRSGTYFEQGDLLVARITPCFENGKQAIARAVPGGFGVASTEVIALRILQDRAVTEFVALCVLAPSVRARLAGRMQGATGRQRLPPEALRDLKVPLPPLAEQRRIAAFLTKLQRRVEIEQARARALAALKAATLAKLFREGLRGEPLKDSPLGPIPESWQVRRLGDLAKIGNGSTPSRSEPAFWRGGTIPWVTSGRVHDFFISEPSELVTEEAIRRCHLPPVPAGSVLVAITGEGKTLGHAALTRIGARVNQHVAFIAPSEPGLNPEFLLYNLDGRYEELRAAGSSGGSTKGALTCASIASLRVPVPPTEEQARIASELTGMQQRIVAASAAGRALGAIFTACLERLMTGDIRLPEAAEAPGA